MSNRNYRITEEELRMRLLKIFLGVFLLAWLAVITHWMTQPRPQNDPILYQINSHPQSLILQADGLVNHEN